MNEEQRTYAINQLKRAANEGIGSEEMSWVEISLFGLVLDCLDRIEQLEKPKVKTPTHNEVMQNQNFNE